MPHAEGLNIIMYCMYVRKAYEISGKQQNSENSGEILITSHLFQKKSLWKSENLS